MVLSKTVGDDLKTALESQDFTTENSIDELRSWYYGPDVFTYIGTMSGRVKSVSDSAKPRLFEQSESVTRAWAEPELLLWLGQNVTYENHAFTSVNLGLTCRCTLTVGGRDFTGEQLKAGLTQEQYELEAFGLAIIALLEDEDFDDLRN